MVLEGVTSTPAPIISGVPQGTVLGPLLFLSYINDMPEAVKHSHTRLFADDALLFRKISSDQDRDLLQRDLSALAEWEAAWQMHFNPSKCVTISINPSKKHEAVSTSYTLHNQVLETVGASKYLGVTISNDLSWSRHVDDITAKANRTVGFLRRNLGSCPTNTKAAAYTAMARPILEYSSAAWNPHLKKDINKLEQVQRRAARFATNTYNDRSPGVVTSLLQKLEWENLEERRHKASLTLLYKINTGLVDMDISQFCRPADSRTRGAERLYVERSSHPVLYNSFFPRTLRTWNRLTPSQYFCFL